MTPFCSVRRASALHVAVVHSADGPSFTTVAASRASLIERLAAYVHDHAEDRLWPGDAARVCTLLESDAAEAAIEFYFDRVGSRWDDEWLVTTIVDPAAMSASPRIGGVASADDASWRQARGVEVA
jgi:hypothetical protein